jgi:hypothetical protein
VLLALFVLLAAGVGVVDGAVADALLPLLLASGGERFTFAPMGDMNKRATSRLHSLR